MTDTQTPKLKCTVTAETIYSQSLSPSARAAEAVSVEVETIAAESGSVEVFMDQFNHFRHCFIIIGLTGTYSYGRKSSLWPKEFACSCWPVSRLQPRYLLHPSPHRQALGRTVVTVLAAFPSSVSPLPGEAGGGSCRQESDR